MEIPNLYGRYLIYLSHPNLLGVSHSGRFKFLILCSSVIVGPSLQWLEFWSHLIVPDSNYVEVKRDWSDLFEKHAELEANPKRAAQIASETRKIADLISGNGVSCYIRELIRRYAEVCRWEVQEPDIVQGHQRRPGREWMGVEDYLVTRARHEH
jgi:hypothetical protein